MPDPRRRAVQYLRMSTDKQAVSLENQAARIAEFAQEHGYEIVRTYADEGISGLTLQRRPALQRLLADVLSGSADFSAILTYDVSRWGRFQDPDQAAHYEFICREAGVSVRYCAEHFDADGTIASALPKSLKRVMAAEYSRELSVKVWEGHRRWARRGYWTAGRPGFGLRRMLIERAGGRRLLANGECKALRDDKVVIAPGPAEEIVAVRRIFELYAVDGHTLTRTAEIMNEDAAGARRWTLERVKSVVRNEAFAGTAVYGRLKSQGVGGPLRSAPRETWVRAVGAVEPVISPELFAAAEARRRPPYRGGDEELLRILAEVVAKEGYVSHRLLKERSDLPSSQTYVRHFGSLSAAYKRIGYSVRYPRRTRLMDPWQGRVDAVLSARDALPEGERPTIRRVWRDLVLEGFAAPYEYLRAYAARWTAARHPHRPIWRNVNNDELIARLKRLLERKGELSMKLIDEADDLPGAALYWKRFGGMDRAYACETAWNFDPVTGVIGMQN